MYTLTHAHTHKSLKSLNIIKITRKNDLQYGLLILKVKSKIGRANGYRKANKNKRRDY